MMNKKAVPVKFVLRIIKSVSKIVKEAQVEMIKKDGDAWTMKEAKKGILNFTADAEKRDKCAKCEVKCSELSSLGLALISLPFGMSAKELYDEALCHPVNKS